MRENVLQKENFLLQYVYEVRWMKSETWENVLHTMIFISIE